MRPLAIIAAFCMAAACASAGRFAPPTASNIRSGLAVDNRVGTAGDVWVDNRSSVPIIVQSITLRNCLNVEPACDVRIPIDMKVPPATRLSVFQIRRKVPRDPYGVTFDTEWSPDTLAKPPAN
jgi:hypothetical protein